METLAIVVNGDSMWPTLKDGDVIRVAGNPIKMSRTAKTSHEYPPKLGAQTAEILGHVLGADADEISKLIDFGAVKEYAPKNAKGD